MKYVDEFRDPEKAKMLIDAINTITEQLEVSQQQTFTTNGILWWSYAYYFSLWH